MKRAVYRQCKVMEVDWFSYSVGKNGKGLCYGVPYVMSHFHRVSVELNTQLQVVWTLW